MQEPLDASLVRIRTADGRVVGAGFLVGERQILTCAHVIAQALDLADYPSEPPQALVSLDFPLIPPRTRLTATVVLWCPPLPDGGGDIAGLELQGELPAAAEVVRFTPAEDLWEHAFRAFGFPAGQDDGVWATGRLLGRQATNWVMIEDVKTQGFAVVQGFSGTPMWDSQLQGVVGMVVAATRPAETKTAFVIPLDVLLTAWPQIKPSTRQCIFISAAPADTAFAARLTTDLQERDILVMSEQQVQAQDTAEKEARVRQAIRAAQAVVLVVSSQTRSSRTVKEHLRLANLYQRRMLLVGVGEDEQQSPPGWRETSWVDAHEPHYAAALATITNNLSDQRSISALLGPSLVEPTGEPRNPYKGLRAFTANDAGDFFGRERLVDELVKNVAGLLASAQPATKSARLLTIIGPSGSGKSSVVMAGLLPRLQHGILPGSEAWVYLERMVPGKHPIEALTIMLSSHFPARSLKTLSEDLQDDAARGLHLLAASLTHQAETKVVLLVDQFEEVFTQTESADERQRFIELLLTASSEPRGPLLVLLTLRADFYDRLMQYPELYRLVETHLKAVLPMEVEDLRATMEQPAALPDVQLSFEGNLVGDLLFEMQGQVGALPLLQFTLDQLFQKRSGHRLTLQAYREIGGVKGALAKHAEETYAALPSEEQRRLARGVFVRLIEPGASAQDTTRRRAALSEFALADPTQTRLLRETIDAFIAARLLTTNEIAGTTTIEVSHEALIREWPRLAGWMAEARQDIPLQQTISKDVAAWEQRGKPKDRLYRGSQLKEARMWAKRNTPSGKEVAFLQASAAYRKRSLVNVLAIVLLLVSTTGITSQFLLQPPDPTHVTNRQDDVVGSLRWAIANAPVGSTITFDPSLRGRTIVLTSDLPIARKSLSIHGLGARLLTISNKTHQIRVSSGSSISMSDLTFTGSTSNFSVLLINEGTLTLTNSTVSGNGAGAGGGSGGGIFNIGMLTLTNSTVSGNAASFGGGISNSSGMLTLTNSTVSGNRAGEGGGIDNDIDGTLTLTNSTVSGNTATSKGGGINNSGTLILTNSTVSGNTTSFGGGSGGGGILSTGTLTLTNSTVSGNTASDGGGISNAGTLTLTNSTVSGNTASGGGGGGIHNIGSKAVIEFCTIYGNKTDGNGGGLAIEDHLEVTGNKTPSQVSIRNSIIAGNRAGTGPDISGKLTSDGYNLIQSSSGATFAPNTQHTTDVSGEKFSNLGIDPMLHDNGGQVTPHTFTHALLPGSPAIDAIPTAACQVTVNGTVISTDQRKVKRPQGNACDIGAYEYVAST